MYLRPLLCLISVFMFVNVAGAAPFAYVTNAGTGSGVDTVTVIDTADNTVVKTVAIDHPTTPGNSTHPYGVAVSQDGRYVYVSNQLSKTISVIDATTWDNTVVKTVTLTYKPSGLAVNPAGSRLYVTDTDGATVRVLNIASILAAGGQSVTGASVQVGSVVVGNGPIYVVVNAAGTKAYVSNSGSGTVSVISANDVGNVYTKVTDLAVGTNPHGLAFKPGTNKLYVANFYSNNFSVINGDADTSTTPAASYPGSNPSGVAVDSNGIVYISNGGDDTITKINSTTDAVIESFPTGPGPFGIAVNASGTNIYVANQFTPAGAPGTVEVRNTSNGLSLANLTVGKNPQAFGQFIGPLMYPVTVSVTGNGTVTPAGGSVNGNYYVVDGGSQAFTIAPANGYVISSVVTDGVNDPLKPTTVSFNNVTGSHTLSAAFALDAWTVTVNKSLAAGATGTVTSSPAGISCGATCSGQFGKNSSLTLTATADSGFAFTGWTNCPAAVGNVCTIDNLTADMTITAAFGQEGGPVKSTNGFYSFIQAAYGALVASDTVTVNIDYVGNEDLSFLRTDVPLVINLTGGYDASHQTKGAVPSTIHSLAIGGNGATGTTVNVDNITIQ